jgi:hypothetical protein
VHRREARPVVAYIAKNCQATFIRAATVMKVRFWSLDCVFNTDVHRPQLHMRLLTELWPSVDIGKTQPRIFIRLDIFISLFLLPPLYFYCPPVYPFKFPLHSRVVWDLNSRIFFSAFVDEDIQRHVVMCLSVLVSLLAYPGLYGSLPEPIYRTFALGNYLVVLLILEQTRARLSSRRHQTMTYWIQCPST